MILERNKGALDNVSAQVSHWCEQARRMCEARQSSDLGNLTGWLSAIDEGMRLRQLDGLGRDESIESSRCAVVRWLTNLQRLADKGMVKLEPNTPSHQLVAARARGRIVRGTDRRPNHPHGPPARTTAPGPGDRGPKDRHRVAGHARGTARRRGAASRKRLA